MTLGKVLRSLSIGFIFSILALGLLPFLILFNLAEMLNLAELETSPLFILIGRFVGRTSLKPGSDKPLEQQDTEQ